MQNSLDHTQAEITKEYVSEGDKRLDFLPSIDKEYFINVESLIYSLADEHIRGYSGAFWEFVNLSNGGKFMFPVTCGEVILQNKMNYFTKNVSSEVAGAAICALAYARLAEKAHYRNDEVSLKRYDNLFHNLRDYALSLDNEDGISIMRFLD